MKSFFLRTRRQCYHSIIVFTLFLLCIFACSNTAFAAEPQNAIKQAGLMDYVATIYDESNGLPTSEVNTILQDEHGYIWIGSYGGLSRYAGHEFENLSLLRENAPQNGIRVLFQDSKKRIWIGTNDSGLYVFENETFQQITKVSTPGTADIKKLSVRSIAENKAGHIYIGTTQGLIFIDDTNEMKQFVGDSLEEKTIENLLCDESGYIWATTSDNELFILKDARIKLFFEQEYFPVALSEGICLTNDGKVYIGTRTNQIMRISMTRDYYNKNAFTFDFLSLGSKETVNDIYQDTEGRIWVCTDNGLGYFEEDDTFYEVHGLADDTIMTQMCEDYEGNLWVASSRKGFIELIRSKFKNISFEANITGQTVNATILYNRDLYIGTDRGLSIMDEYGNPVQNKLTELTEGIRIRNFMADSKGNLWISTYKKYGLLCYNNRTDTLKSISVKEGMPHEQVRTTMELSNGDIAAATNGGIAILRDEKVVTTYTADDALTNEVILCLAQDDQGRLLAGSDGNGIYVIDLDTGAVSNMTTDDNLQSGVILRMVADPAAGGIWISNGASLAFWQNGEIHAVPDVSAGTGSIFDIKVTEDFLWLLKSFGMIKIDREDLKNGVANYTLFTRKDGLTSNIIANSWNYLSKDGMLFLCTGNGVYYINTAAIYKNTTVPKVAISSVTADDTVYYGLQDLTLHPDVQRIVLHLDLLSFGFSDGMLEYYMEGFDKAPIQVKSGTENMVTYTNLPGGDYVFHFKGYNTDGTASQEMTMKIKKEKSFFEQQTFYIVLTMAGLLLLLIIIVIIQHLNKQRILKRQKEYKNMTEQTIQIVAKTIDAKDKYTIGHSNRVAAYAAEIGRRYGLSEEELEQLHYSALLHDIGKIGIPDNILNKTGKLTDEEFSTIKQHPAIGGEILKDFTLVPWISAGAQYHHERYDGKGYNQGLLGNDIPLYARIISVADAYDSMNSTRVYRPSMTPEVIYNELKKGKGTQFDADFAQIMMEMMEDHFEVE